MDSRNSSFTQEVDENIILVREFEAMLVSSGTSRRSFIRNIKKSTNPQKTFQAYLEKFQYYLDGEDGGSSGQVNSSQDVNCKGSPPPASINAIQSLHKVRLADLSNKEKQTICNICCENHSENDVLKCLPCGHMFHDNCIDKWLNCHCTCPVCRFELPNQDTLLEERETPDSTCCNGNQNRMDIGSVRTGADNFSSRNIDNALKGSSWGETDVFDHMQGKGFCEEDAAAVLW